MGSLRTQITVSATVLVVLAIALSGLVIAVRVDHQNRAQVDDQLRARAGKVRQDEAKEGSAGKALLSENGGPAKDSALLAGTDTITRVLSGGRVLAQRGEGIPEGQPVDARPGLSTITIDGHAWRSYVEPTTAVSAGRLQVLQSLHPVEQRLAANTRLIATVGGLATLATALAMWLVAGFVSLPLERLREGARVIRPGSAQRLPEVRRPQEIAELSATLNAMLERLQTSMLATRRFTADAGHELRTPLTGLGMDLETLSHHPGISDDQRAAILQDMTREHQRVVALLDGLQHLARGDAEALPTRTPVDIADLLHDTVAAAQQRHLTTHFAIGDFLAPVTIDGWKDGLGLALANLLDNAALHGRPDGKIDAQVIVADHAVCIAISDDGPGIAAGDRLRLVERFARGESPRSPGSGLGLALVDQQARLHGGALELGESANGGLCARLSLPAAASRPATSR
jgi:two-component system sensor histidine kinase PrrB